MDNGHLLVNVQLRAPCMPGTCRGGILALHGPRLSHGIQAGSHKQRFSTSQPTAELQSVKTNVHQAVDIPTSAAASIKLELWPLRNPVSSIQSRPLIYADPPNVLTGNDRLNIHLLTAIHLFAKLQCTDFVRIIPPAQPHSQDQPSCGPQFQPNPSALQAMSGPPPPTQLPSSAG